MYLRYFIANLLILMGLTACTPAQVLTPPDPVQKITQTADYQARWFRYSEFEWRYIACDVEVARVTQAQGGWQWEVWVPWSGDYLYEQPWEGVAATDESAKHYAEKRMWGLYWH